MDKMAIRNVHSALRAIGPSLKQHQRVGRTTVRFSSTASDMAASAASGTSGAPLAAGAAASQRNASSKPYGYVRAKSTKEQAQLDEMLRVDHAGEVAAVQIYAGQMWSLRGTRVQDTLHHMKEGEEMHLRTVKRLMTEKRVRPTALLPVWEAAGFALGALTGLLGKEAAMACTVAVETTISEHYNDQIRQLIASGSDEKELLSILAQHRDEELEHHDTAIKHGAEQAPVYKALSTVVQAGCSAAIQAAKKI